MPASPSESPASSSGTSSGKYSGPYKESPTDMLRYMLCGLAMGAADVIPGVSGGTIAFITGIYQKLLDGIKAFNLSFFQLFFRGHFRAALASVPLGFLLPLGTGIAISIFSLAKLALYLLHTHPVIIWSFFFGLIVASIALLLQDIRRTRQQEGARLQAQDGTGHTQKNGSCLPVLGLALVAGALFAWWLTGANPVTTSTNLPTLFFVAFIAICAMILPGISGAFILVLLGQYQNVLAAVANFDVPVLAVFAAGCVCGLLSFARILSACLARFPTQTVALLVGVMAGSLRTVWPWKQGVLPTLPPVWNTEVAIAALFCLLGFALPIALSALPAWLKKRQA